MQSSTTRQTDRRCRMQHQRHINQIAMENQLQINIFYSIQPFHSTAAANPLDWWTDSEMGWRKLQWLTGCRRVIISGMRSRINNNNFALFYRFNESNLFSIIPSHSPRNLRLLRSLLLFTRNPLMVGWIIMSIIHSVCKFEWSKSHYLLADKQIPSRKFCFRRQQRTAAVVVVVWWHFSRVIILWRRLSDWWGTRLISSGGDRRR